VSWPAKFYGCVISVALGCAIAISCWADDAKQHLQQGEAFLKARQASKAITEFRAAIELDPNLVEAHTQFMWATKDFYLEETGFEKANDFEERRKLMDGAFAKADQQLRTTYEAWAKEHPDKAVYQWALGELSRQDVEKSVQYQKQALALDPKFAPAADQLGNIAEMCGDETASGKYFLQAIESDPTNVRYQFRFVQTFENTDLEKYRKLTEEFVRHFPKSEEVDQALVYLADRLESESDKIQVLEELRSLVPANQLHGYGMDKLFDAYARTQPGNALGLVQSLAKEPPDPYFSKKLPAWTAYAQTLVEIRSEIDANDFAKALDQVSKAKVPDDLDAVPLDLLKAEAQARGGNLSDAYKGLVEADAKSPDRLRGSALRKYGAEINKSPDQAEADIWQARERNAQPMKDFELTNYDTGKTVRLSDYRGKVVLVNFFFPTCHTCRGEFPFLQKIHEEYGPDKFVLLAVNIEPTEDDAVLPLFKNLKVNFIPLKSPVAGWADTVFDVHAAPVNMLVDKEGRLVLKPELDSSYQQELLERSIPELLMM
jgi:thiol-disulfide isomerase/thioredoxin/Tfp pilus assembly protein PilF